MNEAMIVSCVAYADGGKLPGLTLENIPALLYIRQTPLSGFGAARTG